MAGGFERLQVARWAAREAMWPRRCAGCGQRGMWLCGQCWEALPAWTAPWCVRCGTPDRSGACRCDRFPEELTAIRSVGPHEGWIQAAVHVLKFGDEHARASHLGRLMREAMGDLEMVDALCPIPLHPRRLRERGYNQSALLADAIAIGTLWEVDDVLVRVVDTEHQVGLDAVQRASNIVGAFALAPGADVAGMHIALIDDVVTTGSTAGEAVRTLMAAGAAAVSLVTVSRA